MPPVFFNEGWPDALHVEVQFLAEGWIRRAGWIGNRQVVARAMACALQEFSREFVERRLARLETGNVPWKWLDAARQEWKLAIGAARTDGERRRVSAATDLSRAGGSEPPAPERISKDDYAASLQKILGPNYRNSDSWKRRFPEDS